MLVILDFSQELGTTHCSYNSIWNVNCLLSRHTNVPQKLPHIHCIGSHLLYILIDVDGAGYNNREAK